MSVQLILYPQSYNGQFNAISNVASEKLVDGIIFNTINVSSSYDDPTVSLNNPILNAPPNIINTWYRWRSTATGTPTLPTKINSELYLYAVASNCVSGVYQRLSNLVVGQVYAVNVFFDNSAAGLLTITTFNGTIPLVTSQQSWTITNTFGWAYFNFTAQTTEDIIQFAYTFGAAQTFKITHISVTNAGTQPTGTNFHLEDGQVLCDLYQEEDIPLTLSVDDFKNAAEKVQSYSKDFNLPATKRNNLIFDHIFEITRSDNGIIFNPYIKTQCVLKQDGYILFDGYLRLIDVQDQEGEISYNVNLYSEVVALADVLKDRTFSNLDFTELHHNYNYNEIRNSWEGDLTVDPLPISSYANNTGVAGATATNVLKYPFVDWSHQILLSTSTNFPQLTKLEQAFRPFIKLKYLINRIFEATPFTWTSDFFDSADFNNLFMDFNWGSDNVPLDMDLGTVVSYYFKGLGTTIPYNYATTSFSVMELTTQIPIVGGSLPPNYNDTTFIITSTLANETYDVDYNYVIRNSDTVAREVECQWLYSASGVPQPPINYSGVITIAAGATYTYIGIFTQIMTGVGDTLQVQFKTNTGTADKVHQDDPAFPSSGAYVAFGIYTLGITTNTMLQNLRGELGQWEFLKGIMTMFNIVSIPDKDNPLNITFEPYADIFISDTSSGSTSDMTLAKRSIEHDWTDKVDASEMKLTPLTDLNKKTIFKFVEDDDDYAFNVYKNSTNHLYGSKVFDASAYTILEGLDEIVAEPFAATIIKPLFEHFPDFVTPSIFTSNDEATEFEGFDNAPRIMYDNYKVDLTTCTYYVPKQNGIDGDAFEDQFLQFSHLTDIPTDVSTPPAATDTRDFHFGVCQLFNPIGDPTPNNLYNLYWLPYYNELYNPNTRIMTMKVNLTPADINMFKFNDRVMIKNRSFRVNKIEYKPNDLATVEFILIP